MARRELVTLREDERAHLLALTKKGKVADRAMATALHVGTATVERSRTRLVARAWRRPPDERKGWTRPLRADRRVALHVVVALADETVRRTLPKTSARRG
jgi:hypothetical protein